VHPTVFAAWTAVLASCFSPAFAQVSARPAPQRVAPTGAALAPTFPVSAGWTPLGSFEVPAYAVVAPLSSSRTLVFDGEHVDVYDAVGGIERRVCTTGAFRFPSFIVADEAHARAWVAESSLDAVWEVDLVSGAFAQVASIHFAFAAAVESSTSLVVTASPCGFSCGADLIRLDLATHALTTLGHVPGASGPVAFDSTGGLLYGFEADVVPQPGELWIGRWSAAQLASGAPLTAQTATKFASRLDGNSSIALDERSGHVFFAETDFFGGSDVVELDAEGRRVGVVASSPVYVSNLACVEVASSGPSGALQAFQPRGMRLAWLETDFGVSPPRTFLRTAEPARPRLAVTAHASGRVELAITGAPPRTIAVVGVVSAAGAVVPEALVATVPVRLFSALPVLGASAPRGVTDANGALALSMRGLPHATSVLQAVFFDAQGRALATSAPVTH